MKSSHHKIVSAAVVGLISLSFSSAIHAEDAKTAEKTGECHGVNACKGKGDCGGKNPAHSCAGQNACKGKGWLKLTEKECKAKKGKFIAG